MSIFTFKLYPIALLEAINNHYLPRASSSQTRHIKTNIKQGQAVAKSIYLLWTKF